MEDKKKNRLLSAYYIGGSVTGMNDTDIRRRMDELEARMDSAEDDIADINSSVSTAGSNASTALERAQHGYAISSTGSVTSSETIEELYTKLIAIVGSGTGVTSFTANISGQVFGGIALITSTAYGTMLFFNYSGMIRLCSRNNSTTWSIKSVSFT